MSALDALNKIMGLLNCCLITVKVNSNTLVLVGMVLAVQADNHFIFCGQIYDKQMLITNDDQVLIITDQGYFFAKTTCASKTGYRGARYKISEVIKVEQYIGTNNINVVWSKC